MIEIIPDILRAIVTDVMLVLLLHTVATPKYKNKLPYILTTVALVAGNLAGNIYFYLRGDYSSVVYVDFVMLLFIGIVLKPLFLERLSHWIFAFITLLNIYAVIVFVSWFGSDYFPFPIYANSVLRLLLFGGVIFALKRWILPLYRRVVERWYVYISLLVVLFINLIYYYMCGDDLQLILTVGEWPILLLIVLAICVYISIFQSMKSTLREHELKEENTIIRAQEELLESELAAHNEFVEQARQNRHDLRHHNALLMSYLSTDNIDGAKKYLQQYDSGLLGAKLTEYCKNPVANVVIGRFARRAAQAQVEFSVLADIPEKLTLTQPEVGVLISNLLENACEACEALGEACESQRFIVFTSEVEGERLKIEMRNTCNGSCIFDENGMPKTTKEGGGTGTRSISYLVKKYGGMLNFRRSENVFITQIILPTSCAI